MKLFLQGMDKQTLLLLMVVKFICSNKNQQLICINLYEIIYSTKNDETKNEINDKKHNSFTALFTNVWASSSKSSK